MMKVKNARNQEVGFAVELPDGQFEVTPENGGEKKTVAASTFKRWFTVIEENTEQPTGGEQAAAGTETQTEETEQPAAPAASDEQPPAEPQKPEQPASEEGDKEEGDKQEGENPDQSELDKLLEGGEEVKEDKPKNEKPEDKPALVYNPTLIEGYTSGTKGGKCDKTFTRMSFQKYILDITEYNGFITDVRVQEEVTAEGGEKELKEVYKSAKMSLKDTLEWMGFTEDEVKVARKEIMALRKVAKASFKTDETAAAGEGTAEQESAAAAE